MPTVTTTYFRQELAKGSINLSGDTFYVSLMNNHVNSASTNDLKLVSAWSQVSAYEVSGTNYSAATLASKVILNSSDNTVIKWDANDTVWILVTVNTWGLTIYKNNGVVVGFIDFGSLKEAINGNLTVEWNTNGIANII